MIDVTVKYPLGDDPPSARLIYGQDALVSLRTLPDRSIHMAATSPPYFGLRDYGTGTWEGGSDECDHLKVSDTETAVATSTLEGGKKTTGHQQEGFKSICGHCGAHRVDNQIGLEETPEDYVAKLVEVFREVRRVLRDDGVLWLNLGDSYSTPTKGVGGGKGFSAGGDKRQNNRTQPKMDDPRRTHYGGDIKSKDLLGIPWMVALALRADGWYLRQDIIWHKPNPMPESVTDRCTKAHEYIFLLSKSERYFFDSDAIREPVGDWIAKDKRYQEGSQERLREDEPAFQVHLGKPTTGLTRKPATGRNKRSVWTVNTKPYPGSHFATWPEDLVETLIKAGSGEKGCCSKCLAPLYRQTERESQDWDGSEYGRRAKKATGGAKSGGTKKSTLGSSNGTGVGIPVTTGWVPTCECNAPVTSCTVLDPFSGSATTGAVASRLGRNYVGLDLNADYYPLASARLELRKAPSDDKAGSEPDLIGDLFK